MAWVGPDAAACSLGLAGCFSFHSGYELCSLMARSFWNSSVVGSYSDTSAIRAEGWGRGVLAGKCIRRRARILCVCVECVCAMRTRVC